MVLIRRITLAGLAVMGAVALLSAIWPAVAAAVAAVFVALLVLVGVVLAVVGVRRVRGELVWRRELRTMPTATGSGAYESGSGSPTLAELRDSA